MQSVLTSLSLSFTLGARVSPRRLECYDRPITLKKSTSSRPYLVLYGLSQSQSRFISLLFFLAIAVVYVGWGVFVYRVGQKKPHFHLLDVKII